MDSQEVKKSNYSSVRKALSASELVNEIVDKVPLISSTQVGFWTQITAKVVKGAIYAEDLIKTKTEIGGRVKDVLNSAQASGGAENPKLYKKFQEYVKISLKQWVPDRDYPQIGYLPKNLLYNQELGDPEITKYWPESSREEQERYVALTLNELTLNYISLWENLLKENSNQ